MALDTIILPLPEAGEGRSSKMIGVRGRAKRVRDHVKHAVDVRQYFVIPEAQDTEAAVFEIPGSSSVHFGIMLPAIGFYDQPCFGTQKIGDEHVDRHLSAKLRVGNLSVSQPLPEQPFGIRAVAPKRTRSSRSPAFHRRCPLTRSLRDHPLPQGGEGQGARFY